MIDKELIHQAAEDIDIFQADLTEEFDRLMEARKKPRRPTADSQQPRAKSRESTADSQQPRAKSRETTDNCQG